MPSFFAICGWVTMTAGRLPQPVDAPQGPPFIPGRANNGEILFFQISHYRFRARVDTQSFENFFNVAMHCPHTEGQRRAISLSTHPLPGNASTLLPASIRGGSGIK